MKEEQLIELIDNLIKQPNESEWVEFKENFHSENEIGERISALSNGASIHNQDFGYLVFGIEDVTHIAKGTNFSPKKYKKGNEELENWLIQRLNPRIDFRIYEIKYKESINIVLFVIPAAKNEPVDFLHIPYIRIGSITRKLMDFPEKERKIWQKTDKPFELEIAKDKLSADDVIKLLSTETYFDLIGIPYPTSQSGVIDKLIKEKLIVKSDGYAITNLGAILFAKNLPDFDSVQRKSVRVIVYKGKNKVETIREQIGVKGYALGFIGLVDWINSQLPANEEIGKALRNDTRMYPEIAIRELVANALIHQDLLVKGFPMIEIFSDRIEISNPGIPLITPDRFIDSYISRNENFADLMRRMGFCEEKGSGMDKVIYNNELYQLPPINVIVDENRTRITLYSYKTLNDLDKKEKIRACYQHSCLKWVSNEKMTNQSLRERFQIEDQNAATVSRIIKDTFLAGLIKEDDPENKSRKHTKYIPFWA
ncbi:RNA-binding domain-containing protein [Flavobacterium columnare]|uniref:Transcriptional regulator n=1 Tax=Flavobacterium columnare TaxID=996 RepID=A0AAI8CHN0_9FLAO|nr:RNA-binding domain-containing protein [Flavobacterium columnare]AMO20305.1 transcriptional regulator [Flavobacterium columnare]AUX18264.1 transcriptional regulator [Flavobacterium columnare]QOG57340.1 putative DNA binding domain-containing protein [Flavobacterium columnare]QOG60064.1 putative DNA binding domain-containing protein [Flavobacterium columnare]QOG62784.1 putative DNA binding domain-containing protein [Flavobacterium columnare]